MIHTATYPPQSPRPATGGYRYFFNGQEADNEVLGEGVNLTAEFWQYDTRLGRRWNVDPVFKEYESPYACFAGNPVWFADPNGDTVIVFNNDRITKKLIKQYLKEHFGNLKMFRFSMKGVLSVKQKQMDCFIEGASEHQQLLLNGLVEAITTETKVQVKIEKTKANVCFGRQPIIGYSDDGDPILGEPKETVIPTLNYGGGGTMYSQLFGTYIIGISDKVANETLCSTGLKTLGIPNKYFSFSRFTGSASSTFFHELLDEFLNYYVKHKITPESAPVDEVQYQNAALQNQKLPKRDGKDH